MAARRRPPVRRAYWQDQEVEILLDALRPEEAARRVMASTNKPNRQYFMDASRALRRRGFQRTFSQCRVKFKDLKGRFFETPEDSGPHPPVRKRPPFFEQLRDLWIRGDQPRWEDRRPPGMRPRRGRRVPERPQQPGRRSPGAAPQGEEEGDVPEDAALPGPSHAAPPPREQAPPAAAAPPSPDAAAAAAVDLEEPGPSRRLDRGPQALAVEARALNEVLQARQRERLWEQRLTAVEDGLRIVTETMQAILQRLPDPPTIPSP